MRPVSLTALLASAILLAACEHHQTITYPNVPVAGAVETAFDCPRLDDAILKTEAIRWVMRDDGARLLSPNERAMRTTTDYGMLAASAFACFLCVPPGFLGDDGHHALDGVDHRLLSLLELKAEKSCAASPTRLAGVTDLQMYGTVTALIARETPKPPDDDMKALLAERMRLLDHLRP